MMIGRIKYDLSSDIFRYYYLLFVLNQLDEPDKYSTYFVKIEKIAFHKKVVPGDTLVIKVEQPSPLRHGLAVMKGYLFVGEKLVAEASFVGQITKNRD